MSRLELFRIFLQIKNSIAMNYAALTQGDKVLIKYIILANLNLFNEHNHSNIDDEVYLT